MSQDTLDQIDLFEREASRRDSNLRITCSVGGWEEGDLTYDYTDEAWGPLALPAAIPAYALDPRVVIRPGEPVVVTGLYLPDVDNACAQFLHPYRTRQLEPELLKEQGMGEIYVTQGLKKDEYGDWEETQRVVPTWTLIRRVPNRYIAVPPEGFYPKDKPSSARVEASPPPARRRVTGGHRRSQMLAAPLRRAS